MAQELLEDYPSAVYHDDLSGMMSVDYSQIEKSTAQVDYVSHERSGDKSINVSFNYAIDNFSNVENLYGCTLHYLTKTGFTVLIEKQGYYQKACEFNAASGQATMQWKIFLNEDDESKMKEFTHPLQAQIMLTQKTASNNQSATIIGSSALFVISK